jgi:mono/diheme cytochrome c family protein
VQSKRKKALIAIAIIVAASVAGGLYWVKRDRGIPKLIYSDASQLQIGGKVYKEHCASCHGPNFGGQPNWQTPMANGRLPAPPHDASGHTWHHPDSYLFGVTKYGMKPYAPAGYESDMPAFENRLSDEEIADVLIFIKAHWTEDILEHQKRVTKEVDGP